MSPLKTLFAKALLPALLCLHVSVTPAAAAEPGWPKQPIRLLVPFAPGGSTDALARILGLGLAARLGQPVIIENRPGAGGNIAMGAAARSKPDGYTLLIVSSSLVINPSLYASVPYDAKNSFVPVTYLAAAPSLLVVKTGERARNVKELVADMKAKPASYNYTSPGVGTAQHLAGELFRISTGTQVTHIPFSGAGPSVMAVVSGEVQTGFASLPAALPLVRSGAIRALAITTQTRSPAAPNIPTFVEQGFTEVESDHLQGLLAPAGTPKEIIDRVSEATLAVLKDKETAQKLTDLGFIVGGGSPADFSAEIARQLSKWQGVIQKSGIRLD